MLTTENDLRDALAPLRAVEPTDDQIAAVLDGAPAPAAPRPARSPVRRAWRPALALAGVTAVVAVGVAALPSGSGDGGGAQALLRSAAATAAEQPVAPVSALRYTKTRTTWTYRDRAPGGRTASSRFTEPVEQWVAADRTGRVRTGAPEDVVRTGDARLLRVLPARLAPAGERSRQVGETNIRTSDVPDDAAAARRFLDARETAMYGRRVPEAQALVDRTFSVLNLLGEEAVRPAQRSALFGVLAATEGVRDEGLRQDSLGRSGRTVSLHFAGGSVPAFGKFRVVLPEGTIRVTFDPDDAQVLQWSFSHVGTDSNTGMPDQQHVYLRQGWVDRVGELPPADPTEG